MKPTWAESHRQSLSLMVLYPFLVFLNLLRNRSRWSKTQEWATWSLQCRSWKKGMLITYIERFDLRVKTLHFECARWIRVFYESGNNLRILAWSSECGRDVPAWSKFCLSAATRKGPSASSSDAYWWHRWVSTGLWTFRWIASRTIHRSCAKSRGRQGTVRGRCGSGWPAR
jgi:hypothetical protein